MFLDYLISRDLSKLKPKTQRAIILRQLIDEHGIHYPDHGWLRVILADGNYDIPDIKDIPKQHQLTRLINNMLSEFDFEEREVINERGWEIEEYFEKR